MDVNGVNVALSLTWLLFIVPFAVFVQKVDSTTLYLAGKCLKQLGSLVDFFHLKIAYTNA